MPDISLLAVGIATLVAFGLGGAHYAMLGEQLATVSQTAARAEQTAPWQLAVELARCLVLAATVAGLVVAARRARRTASPAEEQVEQPVAV